MADDTAKAEPKWAHSLEELHRDADEEVQKALLDLLREMLSAPGDDAAVADETAKKLTRSLDETWIPNKFFLTLPKNDIVAMVIADLVSYVFQMAAIVEYPSSEHERLFQLLLCVKKRGPEAFGIDDPSFDSFQEGFDENVEDFWGRAGVPPYDTSIDKLKSACEYARSISVLLARLYASGLTGPRGAAFAAQSLLIGVGSEREEDIRREKNAPHELSLKCRAEIAAQYILIAGKALVEVVQLGSPTTEPPLTRNQWKEWAEAFQAVSESTTEAREWQVKTHCQEAYEKMAELLPECLA